MITKPYLLLPLLALLLPSAKSFPLAPAPAPLGEYEPYVSDSFPPAPAPLGEYEPYVSDSFPPTPQGENGPVQDIIPYGDFGPIQNVSDSKIQNIGSFAVSEYDLMGESHIYFIEVMNGSSSWTFIGKVFSSYEVTYLLWLKAKNCSNPGPPEMFEASVTEVYWRDVFLKFNFLKPLST